MTSNSVLPAVHAQTLGLGLTSASKLTDARIDRSGPRVIHRLARSWRPSSHGVSFHGF
jgi:hypothetical protein